MPDLIDYILTERPELADHPRFAELANALEVDVLGYADDCLAQFRAQDRLADAMADPDWKSWTVIPFDRQPESSDRVWVEGFGLGTVVNICEQYGQAKATIAPTAGQFGRVNVELAALQRWVPLPLDGATLGLRNR